MSYTFLLLLPYTIWCVVFFFPNLLTFRKNIIRPRLKLLLLCIFILPMIVTIPSSLAILRNVLLQIFYVLVCLVFFQESVLKKLSCYIIYQLSGTLIEIIACNLFLLFYSFMLGTSMAATSISEITELKDIILMTLFNAIVGVYFYYNEVVLLKRCLSYLKLRTFVQLLLPILVPVLLQGTLMYNLNQPSFLGYSLIYGTVCLSTYFFFQKGIRKIRLQNQQYLLKTQRMSLLKNALAFSREMEQEYVSLRKWNHDAENHLLSLSYLSDMEKYEEASAYCRNIHTSH